MRTLVAVALSWWSACSSAEGGPGGVSTVPDPRQGPIVLELFTSQGCSSCPSADRLLSRLARDQPHRIAPLSFHVDYWDDLGWADPNASPAWTARQQRYARALSDRSVYTPQLVVGGRQGMVGSNAVAVSRALATAAIPSRLPITASWTADTLHVSATAPPCTDVLVAVWEQRTTTTVPRGENAGEVLTNDRVVRKLERVAANASDTTGAERSADCRDPRAQPPAGAGALGSIAIKIDPRWRGVGAVVFAQRPDMSIVSSAFVPRS